MINIQKNVCLKSKNWFKTGGKTKYFFAPKTEPDFKAGLNFAKKKGLNVYIIGKGANTLISDNGIDGLTINPNLKKIWYEKNYVTAQAGVEIQELIDYCLNNNLIGLEDFSHIPGTIGGSIYINIHYFSKFLGDFLTKARVIEKDSGTITEVNNFWFKFGYDQSKLQERQFFLLSATFKLKKGSDIESAYAKGRRDEIIRYRNRQYPTKNTCGSFFRNFHENEIEFLVGGKKITSVAYYLEKLGIKGSLKQGGAIVSYKHSNMIVTEEGAYSSDIVELAKKMQELVWNKYKIIPQPECQLLGFRNYPFHKIKFYHPRCLSGNSSLDLP